MEKRNDDRVVSLISLSEEVTQLSFKLKQLMEDLHGTSDVLANIKELTSSLTNKVGTLDKNVNSYTPLAPEPLVDNGSPSYVDGINERQRIVPTPQNQEDYMPIVEASVATGTVSATVSSEPVPEIKFEKAPKKKPAKKRNRSTGRGKTRKPLGNKS